MGDGRLTKTAFVNVRSFATRGGSVSATFAAEERLKAGDGIDPLVDPKGPAHLGPIRRSLPRFNKQGDNWVLTVGIPMPEETLLDTTGSMGNNVKLAFDALPHSYEMLASGNKPVLGQYDVQIATAIFNDVMDNVYAGIPVLCRTQFEMGEKIAMQMTNLTPGKGGCGNGKEDPQFGLFAAVYLTNAAINRYGLKSYHFTVSDEPVYEAIELKWLKQIFGDDVLERAKENGYDFSAEGLPDVAQVIKDLQKKAHAFFLQVPGSFDSEVSRQWTGLYGSDHVVYLPGGTKYLHAVKACIIGLTEGVISLETAEEFLIEHEIPRVEAKKIVRAVAHIPLGAQTKFPNFKKLPKAGDVFANKTDLWPIDAASGEKPGKPGKPGKPNESGVGWKL